jgi:hypothetical protein
LKIDGRVLDGRFESMIGENQWLVYM